MAQVIINIPNPNLAEVADALAWVGGYQETIVNEQGEQVLNPVAKNAFAKLQVINYVKNSVKEYRHMLALQAEQEEVEIT